MKYHEAVLQAKLFGDYELALNPDALSCNQTLLAEVTKNHSQWEKSLDQIPADCLTYVKNEDAVYNPAVRPVLDPTTSIGVAFHVLVTQVIEVNAKDQFMLSNVELK